MKRTVVSMVTRKVMLFVVLCLFVICGGTTVSDAAIRGSFGHVLATDSPGNLAALFFADQIKARTNGEIIINVYPNSELGSDRELVEAMKMGAVNFSLSGASIFSPFEDRLTVWCMPFLFENLALAQKVIDSPECADILAASTKSTGVRIIGTCENGFRQLETTSVQVKSLADLQKLKIRIAQSDFFNSVWKALGSTGTALAWSEQYSALQTGVVDGTEVPLCNYAASGFAEVTKYFTFTNYTWDPLFFTCSEKFWQELSSGQQKILMEVAAETVKYQRDIVNEREANLEKSLGADHGIIFNRLSDEAKAEFRIAVQPLYDNYKYPEDLKIVQAVVESLK